MNIKELLQKIAKGEELTAEEKAELGKFDLQKQLDAVAAAARKDADEKLTKVQGQIDALTKEKSDAEALAKAEADKGKPALDLAQSQIADLSKQITGLTAKFQAVETEKAGMIRSQAVNEIRRKAGIQFTEGLDHGMLDKSFSGAFDGLDDLSNEDVIKVKVDTWKAMNKAAILDTSGGGAGGNPHNGTRGTIQRGAGGKAIEEMTADERAQDLVKSGLL